MLSKSQQSEICLLDNKSHVMVCQIRKIFHNLKHCDKLTVASRNLSVHCSNFALFRYLILGLLFPVSVYAVNQNMLKAHVQINRLKLIKLIAMDSKCFCPMGKYANNQNVNNQYAMKQHPLYYRREKELKIKFYGVGGTRVRDKTKQ